VTGAAWVPSLSEWKSSPFDLGMPAVPRSTERGPVHFGGPPSQSCSGQGPSSSPAGRERTGRSFSSWILGHTQFAPKPRPLRGGPPGQLTSFPMVRLFPESSSLSTSSAIPPESFIRRLASHALVSG